MLILCRSAGLQLCHGTFLGQEQLHPPGLRGLRDSEVLPECVEGQCHQQISAMFVDENDRVRIHNHDISECKHVVLPPQLKIDPYLLVLGCFLNTYCIWVCLKKGHPEIRYLVIISRVI